MTELEIEEKTEVQSSLPQPVVPIRKRHRLLPYVMVDRVKGGRTVYYFRRDGRRFRLPDKYGTEEFNQAYGKCLAGLTELNPRFNARKERRPYVFKTEQAVEYGLKKARQRARELGREFDLTLNWCLLRIEEQNHCCAVSGVPFFHAPQGASKCDPYAPSIDRIDCSRGYTQDNCRIVLFAVNVMLFDWGEDVLRTVVRSYRLTQRNGK